MKYLHTMVRVENLDVSLKFYCDLLGLKQVDRRDYEKGKFSLVFLGAPEDAESIETSEGRPAPLLELTHNWEPEKYSGGRNFGHLAFEVDNIYEICEKIQNAGVVINRPPKNGSMAFIKSPDGISIELLQKGESLPPQEPWISMGNTGEW